jgi:two-component system phosphate regulon response regulator OmpR
VNGHVPHVAVVDDEHDIRESVAEYFTRNGLLATACEGGAALDSLMAERAVDLVVLDINMPVENGVAIARRLRAKGRIGIVMLTANGDSIDQVVGLEVGADDYVVKPVEPRLLLARIRAVLRRAQQEGEVPATMGRRIRFGRCILDLDARRLFDRGGQEVPISAMEYDLLRTFAEHPGKVLTRDRILDLAHDKEMEPFDRSVDSRIKRLRKKIEVDPAFPSTIKTVHGAGYLFSPVGTAEEA